jgi:hypothetical protein
LKQKNKDETFLSLVFAAGSTMRQGSRGNWLFAYAVAEKSGREIMAEIPKQGKNIIPCFRML